jgi:hypothetical protein
LVSVAPPISVEVDPVGPSPRDWKYYPGLALFTYSLAAYGIAAATPLFFTPAVAATVAGGVVASGEISFWVSVALLGRPVVLALRARFRGCFRRRTDIDPTSEEGESGSHTCPPPREESVR